MNRRCLSFNQIFGIKSIEFSTLFGNVKIIVEKIFSSAPAFRDLTQPGYTSDHQFLTS